MHKVMLLQDLDITEAKEQSVPGTKRNNVPSPKVELNGAEIKQMNSEETSGELSPIRNHGNTTMLDRSQLSRRQRSPTSI